MRNVELARVFRDIAAYLDMDEVPFKPRAYEKAAQAIESHDRPLDAVYRAGGVKALREIPGIGTSMAEKLEELITTGKCKLREEYHRRMPVDLAALTALEGVGPKAVKVLYERLGVRTLADLEAAARAGKVRALPHFGEKSEQKILKALAFVQTSGQRTPLAAVRPVIDELAAALARMPGVVRVEVAGSIRRRKETVGDADLLALARTAEAAIAAFAKLPAVARVLGQGDTKCSVKLQDGLQVDLRGDLQTQTNWTDGQDSLEAMARAARDAGCEYVAITDHTVSLAMTGGCDAKKLRRQRREIARLDAKLDGIRVLAGAEVNIDRDGTLDIDDETVRRATEAGVPIVIDSDAHSVKHLGFPRAYGVDQARRGWATAKDVLNTRSVEGFLAGLKGGRPRARRCV